MSFKRPQALFVGPAIVGDAISRLRSDWEFINEELPNGSSRPIQNLSQLEEGFGIGTISTDVEIIMINDTLFNPNDPNGIFENAIANFAPSALTLVVSYRPATQDIIRQRVAAKQAELQLDGNFYFVDHKAPNPSIDRAVERFVKESNLKEVSEILLGHPLDNSTTNEIINDEPGTISIYDETAPAGSGEIIAVTSNKGGSGKTTIALSLATYLGHASENSVREGLEDRPLKIIIVDFDVRDGQVGFLTGHTTPTMLDLIKASPLTEDAVKDVIIHNSDLKIDMLLAPKMPAYADELTMPFYRDLLRLLRREYDYIIVDTSVNYLDPLLEKVTYPDADAIIFVCDYVIQALLGMGRFFASIKNASRSREPGEFIDPEKFGIVVNKTLQDTSLNKNMLVKAAQGIPILANLPANPKIAGHASNSQHIDLLMKHQDFTRRFGILAEAIVGDRYKLSKNVQ